MAMPNIEKYRRHVDRFDLTEDQKMELIQTVWKVAEGFADRAFGLDPVHLVSGSREKNALTDFPVLEFERVPHTDNRLTDVFRLAGRNNGRRKK